MPSPERHPDRPDPSEPWRYACPTCGSVVIRSNLNKDSPDSNTEFDYRCVKCSATFNELADRKEAAV